MRHGRRPMLRLGPQHGPSTLSISRRSGSTRWRGDGKPAEGFDEAVEFLLGTDHGGISHVFGHDRGDVNHGDIVPHHHLTCIRFRWR